MTADSLDVAVMSGFMSPRKNRYRMLHHRRCGDRSDWVIVTLQVFWRRSALLALVFVPSA